MNALEPIVLIRQHLIDPEVCIRCNTCEETCPIDAITHDSRNYVVDADICNHCGNCVSPCPTGAIDHWHTLPRAAAYPLAEQFSWDELPPKMDIVEPVLEQMEAANESAGGVPDEAVQENAAISVSSSIPPWSAAHPYAHLYTVKNPVVATVAGNYRLTAADAASDVHHIVLDFGTQMFPILEGQSIGIIPPGLDESGKPHYMRMYSVASPRGGERDGYNNLALTVKRVVEDHAGSNIMMICTGTGSAPMRAMTEHRRRMYAAGKPHDGKLMLFFGARNPAELPYFGPLLKLPADFIDMHLAFSRLPDQPKAYVQDKIRAAGPAVAELLAGDTYLYICGLKGMETGVLEALGEVCAAANLDWPGLQARMVGEGRFHVETY